MKRLCLLFTIFPLSMPALAEQCRISGYDQEYFIGLTRVSISGTEDTGLESSSSYSGTGIGWGFSGAFCISNNPNRDVFLNVGLASVITESPETDALSGVDASSTSLSFSVTMRW